MTDKEKTENLMQEAEIIIADARRFLEEAQEIVRELNFMVSVDRSRVESGSVVGADENSLPGSNPGLRSSR